MSLTDTIRKDMFTYTKDGNTNASDILKMALASIKNAEIEKGEPLTEDEIIKILRKEVKKIEDSILQFEQMGRQDLLEKERAQLGVIKGYLPQQMAEEDIKKIVDAKIKELNIQGMGQMGILMGAVMKETGGQADGNVVKNIVTETLSK
jgi:uncharacterized protein